MSDAQAPELVDAEVVEETALCDQCGSEYRPKRRDSRFCTSACRVTWHGRNQRKDCGTTWTRARGKTGTTCSSCRFRGERNPRWNGGLSFDSFMGRWKVCCRDGSTVWFARAVMEAELGRALRSDEQVHHVNGNTTDDRSENLAVLDPVTHGRLHGYQSGVIRRLKAAA